MAGIAAIFNRTGEAARPAALHAMLAASPHRAREGHAVWLEGPVGLAVQHFRTTPEEAGEQQPLSLPGGPVIAFDGRLDNRRELLDCVAEARAQGPRPPGDAMLALLAYRRWGADSVARLLGDFAFVIWDRQRQHLLLARDALGTRGLYYLLDGERCLAASEIKQLLAHPAVSPELDRRTVARFLNGDWRDPGPTLYRGIGQCPPAHSLLVGAERDSRRRYWQVDPEARIRYRRDEAYTGHFRSLLAEAVRCRLRSDGPPAISLSGGLDSASLAALAAADPRPLHSFSFVFDELAGCDERRFSRPVVERCGLRPTWIAADGLWTLRDAGRWPGTADWPVSDAYVRLPLAVMEAAGRAGCRTLLAGHFGDALFARGAGGPGEALRSRDWRSLARSLRPRARPHRAADRPPVHPGLAPALARLAREEEAAAQQPPPGVAAAWWSHYRHLTAGGWSQGASVLHEFHYRRGLEAALPFWDRRLVEFVLAVPARQLGRPGRSKWLLREAMAGLLPRAVRERRDKTSFYPLFLRGMQEEAGAVNHLLTRSQVVERGIIRPEWLQTELAAGPDWQRQGYYLWLVLSLEIWLRRYWP